MSIWLVEDAKCSYKWFTAYLQLMPTFVLVVIISNHRLYEWLHELRIKLQLWNVGLCVSLCKMHSQMASRLV